MDLHPYDGKERRFRHADRDVGAGIRVVMDLLRLAAPPPQVGLLYDLSFYSGGIGVLDHLAITLPLQRPQMQEVVTRLLAWTPEQAVSDPDWKDDFLWLIGDDDNPLPPRSAAARFINDHRHEFQPECRASDPVWFASASGVNAWTALWQTNEVLSYLSYAQG